MTSVTLNLNDKLVELAKKAASDEGISLEQMLARVVEDALSDNYELDDDEAAAVAEGIADMKAGRSVSHEEMMRVLREHTRPLR